MEKLLLSADGEILLYEVDKKILNNLDVLIEDFYKWKNTSYYDEQLFVKYLQQKFGDRAIIFKKNLGWLGNENLPKEYADIKWYNF